MTRTYNNVSSNCALRFPSTVAAVQLSGQWTSDQLPPRLIIWGEVSRGQDSVEKSVTYGLDGERLTDAHGADRLVLRVVRHVGSRVEEVVDAVSAVRTND